MKISKYFSSILSNIKKSIRRFPVTILVSTTLVIMLIVLLEKDQTLTPNAKDILQRLSMIVALGIPLSVNIKLISERMNNTRKSHILLGYIAGALALVLYYFLFLNELKWISVARYIGVSIFLYLAFLYIPWISRKEGYEYYIIDVMSSFIVTAIYSVVLFIGMVIIYYTIVQLFDIELPEKLIIYTFLVIAGIFAPSLFLAKIPKLEKDYYKKEYLKTLKVLLLYIVIPLITVYSLILYAYFIKIIITGNWPQGLVSHLVLWYSALSVVVIFLITPILDENKWAYRFRNLFPKFVLLILAMMFVAMGIRISEYGITENRYFGLLLGLWVLGIMINFLLKKKLKNIIIPVSLSIIALVSVFGPLSSFTISKLSQNNRFKVLLERNQMLVGNAIQENENIPKEDKEEISMILKYFDDRHSLDDVKYIPSGFKIDDMEKVFGFAYTEKSIYENNYFSYYMEPGAKQVIDVKEYDYFIDNLILADGQASFEEINIYYNDGIVKIMRADKILYEKNILEYVNEILDDESAVGKSGNVLNSEDTTFIDENDNIKVKLIITGFSGNKNNNGNSIDYIEYYMLVKIKN